MSRSPAASGRTRTTLTVLAFAQVPRVYPVPREVARPQLLVRPLSQASFVSCPSDMGRCPFPVSCLFQVLKERWVTIITSYFVFSSSPTQSSLCVDTQFCCSVSKHLYSFCTCVVQQALSIMKRETQPGAGGGRRQWRHSCALSSASCVGVSGFSPSPCLSALRGAHALLLNHLLT